MDWTSSFLPYAQTGYFSKIVLDYINHESLIKPFYSNPASLDGIKAAIADRKQFATDRKLLVKVLQAQYSAIETNPAVVANIQLLQFENTFTICTAHQPNIFTGPLFFIYKILHVAKLAAQLKAELPDNNFVPVYYMGSEDADLDELGHIFIAGEKYEWVTNQAGAVGRMKVDKALIQLLDKVSGQLLVHPFGEEIVSMMKEYYQVGQTIEHATFQLINSLFAGYGLVILLPDNADLKTAFIPVIEKELLEEFSYQAVQDTIANYPVDYKVQASGRELNMFYLKEDKRERIEKVNGEWLVVNTKMKFTKDEIVTELKAHPERFSPNVILRPVFQEWILPNIGFIGGGGEIAYWLQLKKVFEAVNAPYPLLVIRNSFMLVNEEVKVLVDKLKLNNVELFKPEAEVINQLVKRDSLQQISLDKEIQHLTAFYTQLQIIAGKIDQTLQGHVAALQTQALKKLSTVEKKMLRAEKRKFETQQRQLQKIKAQLFPNNNLQERVDNLMLYYAKWGKGFIRMLYEHTMGLEMEFGILVEKK